MGQNDGCMEKKYRKLTAPEIEQLESRGCSAESWSTIEVSEGFDPAYLRNAHFGGTVRVGATGSDVAYPGGLVKKAGIYNASVYDCTIGDRVLISNIGSHVAHYDIDDGTVVENVGKLACEGVSTYGNGVEVSVVNEAGGREVPIYDGLTAQIAYIVAMYRHRTQTVRRLGEMVARYAEAASSARGTIGKGCRITDSTLIVNVRMGDGVTVESAASLCNGTINSVAGSPSRIGTEVIASDFILSRSATVDRGSLLRRCFVGEGTVIENGFSAENSLFFANCHCNHGEACAVFAGPYTVTHHRATLLIAGYFSFFNAGSGANQSNHMYKLGPVHQGVHLRGCKFGSDAYILLPARTGAFTLVTGRHYSHYDTLDMPFSYLIDEEGDSFLIPAANLRSIGTSRDVSKWPNRDKRIGVSSDILNFEMMTPYTADRILRAIEIAQMLLGKYPTAEIYTWNRVKIRSVALKKGLVLYRQSMSAYLGELLQKRGTVTATARSAAEASAGGNASQPEEYREWVDLAGMVAPRREIDRMLDSIDAGWIDTLDGVEARLRDIHERYEAFTDRWTDYAVSVFLGKPADEVTPENLEVLIEEGNRDRESLRVAVQVDAGRDVAPLMSIGYGIDADGFEEVAADFKSVRGLK